MSNKFIVVESGVIQCEHGAQVVLTSTVPKHVIGGEKPLFNTDILQAEVVGCPHRSSKNGQCKKVSSISSATTESNVSNAGGNYLLRVDGCKTDNGSALVLVNPGQTNSVVPVKSTGSAGKITSTILEDAVVDNQVFTETKEYHIYPLRESSNLYRPLRGARDFNFRKDFYQVASSHYSHEKIVTMTQAYLYVTYDGETKEYKVINNGNLYDPDIQDISYEYIPKDSTTKVERGYIPFPKEAGEVKIVYSNLRLTTADVANFKPEIITIGSTKKYHYVNDPQDFSKSKKHTQKSLKNTYLSQKEAKELDKKHFNVVVYLQDPVGEVEDLYEEYENSYHHHYGMNRAIIDDLRAKNQYPYAVSDLLEHFYVDKEEKEDHEQQTRLLHIQYHALTKGLCEKLGALVIDKKIGNNIAPLIDYNRAKDFLLRLKHFDKNFLRPIHSFDVYKDNKRYHYSKFSMLRLSQLKTPAQEFEKHKKTNSIKMPTNKEIYANGNSTKPVAYLTPQEVSSVELNANDENQNIVDGINYINKKDEIVQHLILGTMNKEYKEFSKSPAEVLAILVFNIFFSENEEFETEIKKHAKLVEAREKFYYLLQTSKAQPQAQEKVLHDLNLELNHQEDMLKIFSGKKPLLDEYENLDNFLKKIAFNPKEAAKNKAKNNYGLQSLKSGNATQEIYYNEKLKPASEILGDINAVLKSKELATVLDSYIGLERKGKGDEEHDYYNYLLNLSYMLIAPRALLDEETQELSLFNKDFDSILKLVTHLTDKMNTIGEEKAHRLHEESIKMHYITALYALITHAKIPMLKKKEAKETSNRSDNVTKFLDTFSVEPAQQFPEFHKPLGTDYDKDQKVKTEVEKAFETLKHIDGISSYVGKFDDAVDSMESSRTTDESKLNDDLFKLKKSPAYKALLTSTKSLSFIITLRSVFEFANGTKKATLENLIGFADDVTNVSKSLTALVPSATNVAQESATKALTNVNNIKEVTKEVSKIGKKIPFSSLKALANLGVVGVIVHTINEVNALEGTNNEKMIIAVKTKTAIYLALLFTPAWIALGATIVVELVWAFIKDAIYNSKIERYLYQSLLFNITEHNKARIFSEQEGVGYRAQIMLETFRASGEEYEIEYFQSSDAIREFIAREYPNNPKLFQRAMRNELSQLNAIAYDLGLNISDYKTHLGDASKYKILEHVQTHVRLPRSAQKSFKALVHLHNGEPLKAHRPLEMHTDGNIYYNTLYKDDVASMQILAHTNNEELIIATNDMALKYKVIYQAKSSKMGNSLSDEKLTLENLKIIRLDLLPMTQKDFDYIEEAQ